MIIIAAAQAVVPILTLYVRHLGQTDNLLFVAGFIISLPGMASLVTSGYLGKIGDRIGNHRLLLIALTYSLLINVFCVLQKILSSLVCCDSCMVLGQEHCCLRSILFDQVDPQRRDFKDIFLQPTL